MRTWGGVDLAGVRAADERGARIVREHPELIGGSSGENRARWEKGMEAMMGERENDKQIVVRLPGELLGQIDAFATNHRKETGENVTRSDAVRVLVARALESVKAKARKAKR